MEVIENLQIKHKDKVSLVLGNHDYIYVYDTPSIQTGYNPITHTLINAPENKNLKEWLSSLPIIIEIDGVAYSHAGVANEWSGAEDISGLWNDTSPIWARPGSSTAYKITPQVFGHTPTDACHEISEGVWCIDTFSTMPDGSPIGDGLVLQIIDGKKFSKMYLK